MKKNKRSYAPVRVAYDVETTSYIDNDAKKAIVYTHTFCVDGVVTMLRTWGEVDAFLEELAREYAPHPSVVDAEEGEERLFIPIYVHHLAFEFSFMKHHFEWSDAFAVADAHKVIRATAGPFEFRCSLALTNKGLKAVGHEVDVAKMEGDLDYSLHRHSKTPITEVERGYIDNDVLIIDELLRRRYQDDTPETIPMTKTGYVRRKVRRAVAASPEGRALIRKLTMSTEDYVRARQAFSGGYTHANAAHAGETVEGVTPVDLSSAYPAAIARELFPMSTFSEFDPDMALEHLGEAAMMLDVTIEGVECNYSFAAISKSKCTHLSPDADVDNGRVHSANSLRVLVTDVELSTIMRNYSYESITVNSARAAVYDYLPSSVVAEVLGFYRAKTVLKDVLDMADEYMAAKEDINSVYGMMATDPVKAEFDHVGDGELVEQPVDIDEAVAKHNKSRNRFLFYPWGAWVTAHTRASLLGTIMDMEDAGVTVLYCDTDSIYAKAHPAVMEIVAAANEVAKAKNAAAADTIGLSHDLYAPTDPSGKVRTLGIFEHDNDGEDIKQFKTLGAKRYATVKAKTDKKTKERKDVFEITVAGLNKEKGSKYVAENGGMDFFVNGMTIPPEHSGRLVHTYSDDVAHNQMVDYLGNADEVLQVGFTHLAPAPYCLTVGDEYLEFMERASMWLQE